jgi:hypothetical protein
MGEESHINPAMANAHKIQVRELGTPITDELYKELRGYGINHRIRISGFRNYIGNIEIIKTIIDDISEIAKDFPLILDEKTGIVLELDYDMKDEDFATTGSGHIIHLNASYFCDIEKLRESYSKGEKEDQFVKGTDWRAVSRHETGHVVSNVYQLEALKIACECTGITNRIRLFDYLNKELSLYSTAYEDGREIISECFSGYYSKVGNCFANKYVNTCMEIVKQNQ